MGTTFRSGLLLVCFRIAEAEAVALAVLVPGAARLVASRVEVADPSVEEEQAEVGRIKIICIKKGAKSPLKYFVQFVFTLLPRLISCGQQVYGRSTHKQLLFCEL